MTGNNDASPPSGSASRKTVDIGVPVVLTVRCAVATEMMLSDDLSRDQIAQLVAPEMVDAVGRVRELLGEFLIAAGALGLTVTGTVSVAGEQEAIGV